MGSGSSKSKRRIITFCSQQPLHPTEIPKGEVQPRVNYVKESHERNEEGATQPVLETTDSRHPLVDPDLQLLDDILTESEDCLSWQEPSSKGQKMTISSHESLSQGQEDQRPDKEFRRMQRVIPGLQQGSPETEETQDRRQNLGDSCGKTAPGTRSVFENNNLSKHTCPMHLEERTLITYDDTEEALMDSIEEEYSQLHSIPPACCGKI
ncbi:hypothetical protein GDO81_007191 [Engystomops pustulosus]|uniref:Uncharacterized protein n=1 Tax=Engystomops pustulosus TaxID=76066 RepID=A0AAV7C5H2_ENGPU|nr:hypothetical protein GDO81_007191 [Engystomops pustulosus]